ncbi:MAG: RecQ family ATP-dependent DNA helicase [Culturomica sp.]|nr:RecQ family ATP-dependent DNA helicase [Culturomica sp.]
MKQPADIHEILRKYWGYETFRSLQEEIIRSVLAGKDTLALMPTGGGKSVTYQVSALVLEGICLVVTPLIALMKDQVEELKRRGIPAEAIYTGLPHEQVDSALNRGICSKLRFLYLSPERLASERFRERLKQMPVTLIAVDEAHCISQWGYDFRPSYRRIAEIRGYFPEVPVLALTATATPVVAEDIQRQLGFRETCVLTKSFRRENIAYVVREVEDKAGELVHILSSLDAGAIVYVRKRDTAEQIARLLEQKGLKAHFYHAGLTAQQRSGRQEAWKSGEVPVMVATNAFGMGIDKANVRIVVHFDIPDTPEAYFQEAGRAGRDGEKAYAVLLYNRGALTGLKTRFTKNFPDKKTIRRVYEALGNYFQIAEGSGKGYAFEFDPERFVRDFGFDYLQALSAVGILQMAGYIECTTEINSYSRIGFALSREQLNYWEPDSALSEQLLVLLMRTYPGIFSGTIRVSEKYLSEETGRTRHEVYEALLALARRKVIVYIPGNDRPYIVYHQPRLPVSYITIGKEAYEERKKLSSERLEEMIRYVREGTPCRQLFLMRYFGQPEKEPCGICDLCLERKKQSGRHQQREAETAVRRALSEKPQEVQALVRRLEAFGREEVVGVIRKLLDEGILYYREDTFLAMK